MAAESATTAGRGQAPSSPVLQARGPGRAASNLLSLRAPSADNGRVKAPTLIFDPRSRDAGEEA